MHEQSLGDKTTTIPGTWIDKSVSEVQPGFGEYETDRPELMTPLEQSIFKVLSFEDRTLPTALQQFNKSLSPLDEKVSSLMAMFQAGMTTQQVLNQTVAVLGRVLDRMERLERKFEVRE